MFWFVCMSYLFSIVWCKKDIKSNCFIVLFELFPVFWMWWKSISFQLYWSIKGLIFGILWRLFAMFWWFNATVKAYWKQLSSLFCGFIVAFLFFDHSGRSTYDPLSFSNLLFEGGNTINQYYQEQTCFLSLVLLNLLW